MGVQGQEQHGRNSQQRKCTETPKQEAVPRSGRDTGSLNPSTGTSDEMSLKSIKCFNCKRKSHFAKMCPESKKKDIARKIKTSEESGGNHNESLWLRTVMVRRSGTAAMRGPTYKVPIEVNEIKTRALLNHGAQN